MARTVKKTTKVTKKTVAKKKGGGKRGRPAGTKMGPRSRKATSRSLVLYHKTGKTRAEREGLKTRLARERRQRKDPAYQKKIAIRRQKAKSKPWFKAAYERQLKRRRMMRGLAKKGGIRKAQGRDKPKAKKGRPAGSKNKAKTKTKAKTTTKKTTRKVA